MDLETCWSERDWSRVTPKLRTQADSGMSELPRDTVGGKDEEFRSVLGQTSIISVLSELNCSLFIISPPLVNRR